MIVQIFGARSLSPNQVNGLLVLTTIDTLAQKRSIAFQVTCEFTSKRWRFFASEDQHSLRRNQIRMQASPAKQSIKGEQISLIEIPPTHASALVLILADGLSISGIRLGSIDEPEFRPIGIFENKKLWVVEWPAEKTWKTAQLTIIFNGQLPKYLGTAPINSSRCFLLDEFAWHPVFFHDLQKIRHLPPENNFPQTLSITLPYEWKVVANGLLVQNSAEPLRDQAQFVFDMKGAIGQHFSGLSWVAAPNWKVRYASLWGEKTLGTFSYQTPDFPDKASEFHKMTQNIFSIFEENYTRFPLARCDVVELSDFPAQSRNCGSLILISEFDRQLDDKVISRLAHEISHSWFGNTIRVRGKGSAWLGEGFAAFSELQFWSQFAPSRLAEMNQKMALRYFSSVDLKSDQALMKKNGYETPFCSEALFQGKGGYIFFMLRTFLGTDVFQKILQDYFREFASHEASVSDFIHICEAHSPKKLGGFFKQWLDRPGAPEFVLQYSIRQENGYFKIDGKVCQVPPKIYRAPAEIYIETRAGVTIKTIWVDSREVKFSHTTDSEPVAVAFDPQFKLLRHTEAIDRLAFIQQSIRKGQALTAFQKYNEALKLFQLALAQDSTQAEILYRKGKVLLNQQKYHSAFRAFEKAASYAGGQNWIEGWSYFRIGQIYDLLRLRDKAIANYQKALDCTDTYRLHRLVRAQLRTLFFATTEVR